MRLTTRGRYAVTAMVDLAMHYESTAVTLADIAGRQHISTAYLEQLFSRLKKAGLVTSVRGASGGYKLARPMNEIFVIDIINAVNESVNATRCEGKGNCHDGQQCLTHDLWQHLSDHIESYLTNIHLQHLVNKQFKFNPVGQPQRLVLTNE